MIRCSLCNKEFITTRGLSSHISIIHRDVGKECYYLDFVSESHKRGMCETCGVPTKFRDLMKACIDDGLLFLLVVYDGDRCFSTRSLLDISKPLMEWS